VPPFGGKIFVALMVGRRGVGLLVTFFGVLEIGSLPGFGLMFGPVTLPFVTGFLAFIFYLLKKGWFCV
jgi:hypothetical protein